MNNFQMLHSTYMADKHPKCLDSNAHLNATVTERKGVILTQLHFYTIRFGGFLMESHFNK